VAVFSFLVWQQFNRLFFKPARLDTKGKWMLKGQIDAALVAHIKWLVIFKNHLSGVERNQLDPEVVRADAACSFGQWLHANQGALPFPDQFAQIETLHAAFHFAAAEMAAAVKANQNHKEIKRQMVELQSLSAQLIAALSAVKANLYPLGQTPMPETRPGTSSR
jgi:hypothetical protein